MICIISPIAWIACGLLAAGFMNAHFRAEYPTLNSRRERRGDLGMSLGLGLTAGPIALLVSVFVTGFCMDGWSLSGKPLPHNP